MGDCTCSTDLKKTGAIRLNAVMKRGNQPLQSLDQSLDERGHELGRDAGGGKAVGPSVSAIYNFIHRYEEEAAVRGMLSVRLSVRTDGPAVVNVAAEAVQTRGANVSLSPPVRRRTPSVNSGI